MRLPPLTNKQKVINYIKYVSYTGESLEDARKRIIKKRTKLGKSLARNKIKV